jgi:hypothetical protein
MKDGFAACRNANSVAKSVSAETMIRSSPKRGRRFVRRTPLASRIRDVHGVMPGAFQRGDDDQR